jgi:polyisoprenoid-binding protein YceI
MVDNIVGSSGSGQRVTGAVSSPDGWPLAGITVTALGVTGEQLGRVVTDSAGAFEFPVQGADGSLTLVLAGAGIRPYARAVPLAGARVNVGRIVLGDNVSVDGPPPGSWDIDPAHTIVKATARHLGMTRVEGRFVDLSGRIEVGETMQRSTVAVSIVAASLTTGNTDRDTHLRSADFLDVERFPELTFRSTSVIPGPSGGWQVEGGLTIRDITRPVILDLAYLGIGADPWGGTRAAFSATGALNRRDYEMNWNMGLPGGMLLVGPTLRIDLDVQAVLQA